MEVAVVRYSELGLKSDRVRRRMEERLMRNIEVQTGGKAFKRAARILVVGGEWEKISKVFGVASWSPAVEVRADLDEIKETALGLYKEKGGTFRVTAQRVTKEFPLTSMEINREVGAYIVEKTGAKVDLKNPEVEIGVEIVGRKAYLFTEWYEGPGGLPVGVEGRAVLLFSGGIDSPVAGWMVGKRGVEIFPLHLFMGIDPTPVLEKLGEWFPGGLDMRVVTFDRDRVVRILEERGKTSYYYLVLKGIMYRRAEDYAGEVGADAVVTGETIGQVASQTLRNLRALDAVVNIPVLRPLVGMNKDEVIRLAKRIGTYEESIRLPEPCAEVSYRPVTRADPEVLLELLEEVEG